MSANARKSLSLPALLLLLSVGAGPTPAQDDEDHTPPARVLSMTVGQWNADFARRHGGQETEASDREALRLYADCLRVRNDVHLHRLPVPRRARLTQLRAACHALSDDALSLSMLYSGSGTMYIEIFASADVDDEEFAWSLIRRAGSPSAAAPADLSSSVQARFARMARIIQDADPARPKSLQQLKDAYGEPVPQDKTKQCRDTYVALRADLADLRGLTARLSSREAFAVSRYAARRIPNWLNPFSE